MDNFTLILLALFSSTQAHAQEMFFGYGLGVFNSAKNSPVEVKVSNVGYRLGMSKGFYWQLKGGYWGEGSGDHSRSSSFYVSTGPGLLVDLRPIELRSGWSVATISRPDAYLGGRFPQFNGEIYGGLRDKNDNGIGLKYEHISSAGLVVPNEGRDFVLLEISWRW